MSKMPFREKLKKAFKTGSPSSSKSSSPVIAQSEIARWPSNVYRPDEPMPRAKYRAPVKKEHKEKLEAFNFGSSWRRRSHVSLYSPMGSRLPSRRGSRVGRKSISGQSHATSAAGRDSMDARRKSIAQQSGKTGSTSRSNSITSSQHDAPSSTAANSRSYHHRPNTRVAQPTSLQAEPEHEGDDDVANVGLSRVNSHEKPPDLGPDPAHPIPDVRDSAALQSQHTQPAGLADQHHLRPGHDGGSAILGRPDGRGSGGADQEVGGAGQVQEAAPSKKDSGQAGQYFLGGVDGQGGGKMFTEEDLALALSRSGLREEVAT